MRYLLLTIALLFGSCVGPSEVEVLAERAMYDAVINDTVMHHGEQVPTGWLHYIENDPRITQEEVERRTRTIEAWNQRLEAQETQAR